MNIPILTTNFSNSSSESTQMISSLQEYEKEPLVSLEEATRPLINIIPDIEQMIRKVTENCTQQIDNLSLDEVATIMLYTLKWRTTQSSFRFILDKTLHSQDQNELRPWFLYLRLFINSLTKLPSISFHTVYRGINKDMTKIYSTGEIFIWWEFIICTSSIELLEKSMNENEARTIFIIECDSAKDISKYSFNNNENEIILYPPRQFQVISLFNCGNQLQLIQLKEIQLDNPSIQLSQPKLTTNPVSSSIHSTHHVELMIDEYQDHSRIDLIKQNLTDGDMNTVVTHAIKKKQCKKLLLSENLITSIGSSIIAKALNNNTTLEFLSLSYNHLCDEGIKFLAETLSLNNCNLQTLSLHATNITDKGVKYLSDMLKKNKTLTWLHLGQNEISDQGVQFLADALTHHNDTLKALSLSQNKSVTDTTVEFLDEMLKHNKSLETLWIKKCNLSLKETKKLRETVQQTKRFFILLV